jgi:hypothetical protein
VFSNLYHSFTEVALKMHHYRRSLPAQKRPSQAYIVDTFKKLVEMGYVLIKSRGRGKDGYVCAVRKEQVVLLAARAWMVVLKKRQAGYGYVVKSLEEKVERLRGRYAKSVRRCEGVIEQKQSG